MPRIDRKTVFQKKEHGKGIEAKKTHLQKAWPPASPYGKIALPDEIMLVWPR